MTASLVMSLRGVRRSYRLGRHVVPALQGVDLDVRAGEMLALTGPSGSGKSTLLNLCGLIDRPDAGAIVLRGEPVHRLDERRRTLLRRDAIGFVFQHFNLVPVMTAQENVELPLFLAGLPDAECRRRAAQALERVGLRTQARQRPDELSGGQRQRVAIARALVKRPALVVADEPTASLDSHTAEAVLELMRERCHGEGVTFVFATHDERLSARCDRIVHLRDGRIEDPPHAAASSAGPVAVARSPA
ncbi:ABC transporter ATP-binding protein [Azohydromonas aeria]|uniref:ABC transporter ATP-binding protein n=1 Tax=Azohydromonas aeria TaxID=2590212 RepID=UPI001E430095|nr:ABC transporter ATP-binding protein [Azohydromonas aeria]